MFRVLTKKTWLIAAGMALLLTASATATSNTCSKSYGTWTTEDTFDDAVGGPWMTLKTTIEDSSTGCDVVLTNILIYGVSNQQIVEFDGCRRTHFFSCNPSNIWFDVLTDCSAYGYINIP